MHIVCLDLEGVLDVYKRQAVACGRAALYIVAKAVHALGLPRSRLADGVVHRRLPSRLELVGVGLLCGELVFVVEPAPNAAEVDVYKRQPPFCGRI